jgi:hypothetical protein
MSSAPATRGVRHARVTASLFALGPGPFKVACAIRYMLADGEAAELTQAEIARVAQVSPATVNAAINSWLSDDGEPLEGAPVTVEIVARRDIRGYRWRMTPRPPAELVAAGGQWHARSANDHARSVADQGVRAAAPPSPTPSPADRARSVADQHEDHDQYKEEGEGETPTALLSPDQTLLFNALLSEGIQSKQHAMEAITNMPGATLAEFREQVAYAAERGKYAPAAFVLTLWARGQHYRRPAAQPAPITAPSGARGGRDNAPRRSANAAADAAHSAPGRVSPSVSTEPPPGLAIATIGAWGIGKSLAGR